MSSILTQIIFGIQKRARWRRSEWLRVGVLVLLSTTNCCSTWRGDSPEDPSEEVGEN